MGNVTNVVGRKTACLESKKRKILFSKDIWVQIRLHEVSEAGIESSGKSNIRQIMILKNVCSR